MEEEAEESKVIEAKDAKKKNKDTDVVPLQRPLIFICNDIYARALLPLKEIALTVKIEEASREKLVTRLREICKSEKVQIDDRILRELAEETRYDARSCINTLQFIASHQRETNARITMDYALEQTGKFQCLKDLSDSIFTVGDQIMLQSSLANLG